MPAMSATVVLQGGGPFVANDDLDRRLVGEADHVVVLPTADAFEQPERLIAAAMNWGERLGVIVEALMVLQRQDALDPGAAAVIDRASVVYLVGDQPLHLRSVLKDTPVMAAIEGVLERGGTVVACAGSAAGVCDPLVDPRGGAFTLGLALISGVALMTEAEQWSAERRHRTLDLAASSMICVAALPSGSALVHQAGGWELIGEVEVSGTLPD